VVEPRSHRAARQFRDARELARGSAVRLAAPAQRAQDLPVADRQPLLLERLVEHLPDPPAMAVCREALETFPGNAFILYNVACLENLLGRPNDALATLGTALEQWPEYKDTAREDDDFASLRDDPRFTELVG